MRLYQECCVVTAPQHKRKALTNCSERSRQLSTCSTQGRLRKVGLCYLEKTQVRECGYLAIDGGYREDGAKLFGGEHREM